MAARTSANSVRLPSISVRIGASTLVTKPCDPGEVVHAVNRLLWRVRPLALDDGLSARLSQLF